MATKSITITEDAYNRLASLKQEKESFSDVIKRIAPKRSLLELAGILTDKQTKELKRNVADFRKQFNEDLEKRRKRFHDH
ncbi:MAG TPA: antitoxin VapB family protein [Candidatus Nanoarchaeia archaeon]|nr:antitoxin VapB family protein [Candidatus Nanoarchaeia archaeon]